MIHRLIIKGPIPSKKNSRNIFRRGGKIFNIPSKSYKAWHDRESFDLVMKHKIENIEKITMNFYFKDNRRKDLTNAAESVADLLVDCGIIEDDRWQITGPVLLVPKGINKFNPRVEVEIYERV